MRPARRTLRIGAGLLVALVAGGAVRALPQVDTPLTGLLDPNLAEEEYRVYERVLEDYPRGPAGSVFAVDEGTLAGPPPSEMAGIPGLAPSTRADFATKNRRPYRLLYLFEPLERYQVVPRDDVVRAFRSRRRWRHLAERHAEAVGLFALSRVGFDDGRRQALVHVVHHLSRESSEEAFALLRRSGDDWRVESWSWIEPPDAAAPPAPREP